MSAAYALDFPDRHYDPALGRFLTPDPIGLAGGDANLYRYVGNNPANFSDPLGLKIDGPIYTPTEFNAVLNTSAGQTAMNDGFINSDIRFVYTGQGVMDMRHVQAAYNSTQSLMTSGVPSSLAGTGTYAAGVVVEMIQGAQEMIGITQQFLSTPRSYNTDSSFSPEDIPSNKFGINGARQYNNFTNFVGGIQEPMSCMGGY